MVGGNKGIIIVARPARLPQVRLVSSLAQSLGILFLLRFSLRRTSPPPLASTFVFDYGGQAGGFPIHSFSGRGGRHFLYFFKRSTIICLFRLCYNLKMNKVEFNSFNITGIAKESKFVTGSNETNILRYGGGVESILQ
ncbi:hypothetical protein CANDROIZ_440006 [Candidatus Roizmanbacteria bacterium]|nr:hypothetical protein CANDROIZ_440006 [Candidatus Roizmanbacteria bacterium]